MSSPNDRPDEDFAPLEPEDRPARRRRDDDDRPHYEEPHRGVLILVLGIVGLVSCPILGVAAWIMGNNDLKKMNEGIMDPEGKSNTQVGKVLGIVATIWLIIGSLLFLLYIIGIAAFIGFAAQQKPVAPAPQPVMKVDGRVKPEIRDQD